MVVVDASFLVAVFLEEAHTEFARGVLEEHSTATLGAPALVHWEIANVAWKKLRRGEITAGDLAAMAEFLDSLRLQHPPVPNAFETVELAMFAHQSGLSAYDASYLALAVQQSAALATTDQGLTRAALAAGLTVLSPFA